jgi:hypothetical protein
MSLPHSTDDLALPANAVAAPADGVYEKLTVAGGVFFLVLETIYFFSSGLPAFDIPSADAFGAIIGRDFVTVWMGGRVALVGGPAPWFDAEVYSGALRVLVGHPDLFTHYWSYPPHVILFTWPFGLMPYLASYLAWCLLGFGAYLLAAYAGGVSRRQFLFLALAPAAAINVFFGQNGFFTAALLIGGLANLDRRPILSGVLFGILTIKPQLGLLLPIMLVLSGRWRVIASTAVTVAVLAGVTAWLYGPDIWSAYLDKVVPQQQWLQSHGGGLLLYMIGSAFYAWRLLSLPVEMAWMAQAAVSGLAVAAVVWTYWRRRDPMLSMALLVTATFLATPYVLNYDMVVLAFVVALLRERADNEPIDHYLALAIWTLPVSMMLLGVAHIPVVMLVLPAFAARLLWRLARQEQPVSHKASGPGASVPAPVGAASC